MTSSPLSSRYGQRGVALITALLVVAIAGVLAVELVWHTNLDLRRTEGLVDWEQARQFDYGAEYYAISLLQEALDEQGSGSDNVSKKMNGFCGPNPPAQFALDRGGIIVHVCDMQGRFNLNNLVGVTGKKDPLAVQQFGRLLATIGIPSDAIETVVDSTVDWIDQDSTAEGFNGAEDDWYTSQDPPHHAANWWFTDASELRAVKGVTPEIYEALRPYVTALPVRSTRTIINVNSAAPPIFMSLGDKVSAANAESWSHQSFSSAEEMKEINDFIDPAMRPYIGYAPSTYFQLDATISVGTTLLHMYSLLEIDNQSSRVWLRSSSSIVADATADEVETVTIKDGKVTKADE